MMNEGELVKYVGEVVAVVGSGEYVKGTTVEEVAKGLEGKKGDESCVVWEEDKVGEYDGTFVGGKIRELRERRGKWQEEGILDAVGYVFTHQAPLPNSTDVVAILSDTALPSHSPTPNSEWRIDPATSALSLHLISDVPPHQPYTVSYGAEPTHYILAKHNVKTHGKNPFDRIEVAFEVPPAIVPTLTPYFDDAAQAAAQQGHPVPSVLDGNITRHCLTVDNPYPITMRLSARAHQGPTSTEDAVDCCLEKLFIGMRDAIQSKEAQQAVREAEFDVLISSLSRLSHTTTLRKGGGCHKILREPPTTMGETLAGVPLSKCLSLDTALSMPDVTNGGIDQFMTERQIRTLQVAYMKDNIEAFVPSPTGCPLFWSDEELAELKGTEAETVAREIKENCTKDLEALRGLAINVSDAAWKWAAALVAMCTVRVKIPEETVRINIADGEAKPVTWEDEDGDRIKFRVEEGKLIYSLNGEDRPAIEKIEVMDGVSLRFPLIDKEVELIPPNHPNNAYKLVFSYIRALAEQAGVEHDIPEAMTFTKQAREVDVIIPGAAKLPHHPIANPVTYGDNAVWATSSGGHGIEVTHFENAGNGVLVGRRGEIAVPNPHTAKTIVMEIPCRALGAEETEDDKRHGMMLQCANLIAEGGSAEVAVEMPDLEQLQSGAKVSFKVTHTLTLDNPLPKSLLWLTMISLIPTDAIQANVHEAATLEGIRKIVTTHGSIPKASEIIGPQIDALLAAYPTTLDHDVSLLESLKDTHTRQTLALRLRVQEKTIIRSAQETLQKLAQQ